MGEPLANQEHLNVLKRGLKAWNAWRRENTILRPDLTAVNFEKYMQKKTSLDDAYDYWLQGIDLHDAVMSEAILDDGNFDDSSFEGADLRGASLRGSSLRNANVRAASLVRAELVATDLTNADFAGVLMGDTILGRIDLSEVRGLSLVHHRFSSIVDVVSVELTAQGIRRQSSGRLETQVDVQRFFANCGVPSSSLDYFDSLLLS